MDTHTYRGGGGAWCCASSCLLLVCFRSAHLHRCVHLHANVRVWQRCSEKPIHTQNVCCCCLRKVFLSIAKSTRDTRHSHKRYNNDNTTLHTNVERNGRRTQRNENINGELASANNYNIKQANVRHFIALTHKHTSTRMQRYQITEKSLAVFFSFCIQLIFGPFNAQVKYKSQSIADSNKKKFTSLLPPPQII